GAAPGAIKAAKKAKDAYDTYQGLKGKYNQGMDKLQDLGSSMPPSVRVAAKKKNTLELDWDGVPSGPVWNFKKASSKAWALRAVKANLRAARAAREAEDDLAEAAHHEEVARAASEQAKRVIMQAQQDALTNAVRSPSVKPFIHFCNHLAKVLTDDPSHAREPATMELRRFCQGFQEDLQSIIEAPEVHGSRVEQRLFDSPPQEFVREPHWAPHSPSFQPPKLDIDHRLAVEACLPAVCLAPTRLRTCRMARAADFL
ncbi:unnamed protein product, partial [Symbiodinium pilosum]